MPMQKILIIRLSSIGDIVLTTPVVRCIKEQAGKNIALHYVTKDAHAGILEANPYIDKVHRLKTGMRTLIRELRNESFDYVVDLHNNLRSARIRLALGKPSGVFPKLNIEKWLLVNFKVNRLPDLHIVDRYFMAASALKIKNDGKGLDYFIPEECRSFPPEYPDEFRKGFIAFSIGGLHATKRMPNHKIVAICRSLTRPVVLLGGPADRDNAEDILRQCGPGVYNACGRLSLNNSAFVISQADAVITHDTGLMHIAAALGKTIVSVWGNTVPAFGMTPYMPQHPDKSHVVEVSGLSCRPCSKIGHKRCPKGHFRCMEDIPEIDVAKLAEKGN